MIRATFSALGWCLFLAVITVIAVVGWGWLPLGLAIAGAVIFAAAEFDELVTWNRKRQRRKTLDYAHQVMRFENEP